MHIRKHDESKWLLDDDNLNLSLGAAINLEDDLIKALAQNTSTCPMLDLTANDNAEPLGEMTQTLALESSNDDITNCIDTSVMPIEKKNDFFQPHPLPTQVLENLTANKTKSNKRGATHLTLFDDQKTKMRRKDPNHCIAKAKAKFKGKIDEQQKLFLSIFDVISDLRYTLNQISKVQLEWLQGKKVTYLGTDYKITASEYDLLIEMLYSLRRNTLFLKLWNSNPQLPPHVFQMEGEKLYPLLCYLVTRASYKPICMDIWLKAKKLLPWLKLNNNEKLIELFMLNSGQSSPFFSAFLFEECPEIKDWYNHCGDIKKLNLLFDSLMFFSDEIFTTLMGENSPLRNLFSSFSDEKKLTHLFNSTTDSVTTNRKFSLLLNLCSLNILKTLLQRLQMPNVFPRQFVLPALDHAIRRQENKASGVFTRFTL